MLIKHAYRQSQNRSKHAYLTIYEHRAAYAHCTQSYTSTAKVVWLTWRARNNRTCAIEICAVCTDFTWKHSFIIISTTIIIIVPSYESLWARTRGVCVPLAESLTVPRFSQQCFNTLKHHLTVQTFSIGSHA